MPEVLRGAGAEEPVQRPALPDVEYLAAVIGVEEAAVADLPLFNQMDTQDCPARDDECLGSSRRDYTVLYNPQRSASESVFSSLVGSGARFIRNSQYAS